MAAVVFAEAVEALARVAVALVDAHLGRRAGVRLAEVELRKERGSEKRILHLSSHLSKSK